MLAVGSTCCRALTEKGYDCFENNVCTPYSKRRWSHCWTRLWPCWEYTDLRKMGSQLIFNALYRQSFLCFILCVYVRAAAYTKRGLLYTARAHMWHRVCWSTARFLFHYIYVHTRIETYIVALHVYMVQHPGRRVNSVERVIKNQCHRSSSGCLHPLHHPSQPCLFPSPLSCIYDSARRLHSATKDTHGLDASTKNKFAWCARALDCRL